MYMTASRILIEEQPVLKLRIHDFSESDTPFLDSLQIDQTEDGEDYRFILIHSQDDFRKTRAAILERYKVLEEKGPKVMLEAI